VGIVQYESQLGALACGWLALGERRLLVGEGSGVVIVAGCRERHHHQLERQRGYELTFLVLRVHKVRPNNERESESEQTTGNGNERQRAKKESDPRRYFSSVRYLCSPHSLTHSLVLYSHTHTHI